MRWTVGALIGAAVLVLAAGCSTATDDPDGSPPAAGASGQPDSGAANRQPVNVNVAEALKTVEKEFGLLEDGNWAEAWQLWTDTAKKEVPKDVFVKANTECPAALKQKYQLQDVKPINEQLVELAYRRGDTVHHGALHTAKGVWLFEPGSEMLLEYASGADTAIGKRKSADQC